MPQKTRDEEERPGREPENADAEKFKKALNRLLRSTKKG